MAARVGMGVLLFSRSQGRLEEVPVGVDGGAEERDARNSTSRLLNCGGRGEVPGEWEGVSCLDASGRLQRGINVNV